MYDKLKGKFILGSSDKITANLNGKLVLHPNLGKAEYQVKSGYLTLNACFKHVDQVDLVGDTLDRKSVV